MSRRPHGQLAGYAAILLWSTSAAALSFIDPQVRVHTIVAYEFTFAAILTLLILVRDFARGSPRTFWGNPAGKKQPGSATIVLIVAYCCLDITHELSYFEGLRSSAPFAANFLNYLWPLWLALFTFSSRRFMRVGAIIALCLPAICGVAIMTISHRGLSAIGTAPLFYGLGASISGAGYMILFVKLSREHGLGIVPLLFVNLTACSVVLWAIDPAGILSAHAIAKYLPVLLFLALFTVVIPEILWAVFLKFELKGTESVSAFLIPFFSTVWLACASRRFPSIPELEGGSLILFSLFLSSRLRNRTAGE
jgi:drug/metabolite transporter (DMT)-like permease